MTSSAASPVTISAPARRRWRTSSLALITLPWLILYFGGIFTPGLLDDVDSIYIEIAREMLLRRDYVTPYIDGIRFFDKPPLMYWLAAGSMHIFGVHDWAARLPLALGVLALLFAVYALGIRLFAAISPAHAPDRAALYAALAMALSIGPWLYTRFYIPDILIALWMTLAVHLFLIALDRASARANNRANKNAVILSAARSAQPKDPDTARATTNPDTFSTRKPGAPSTRGFSCVGGVTLPMLGFAAVVALSVLTKGLIGLIFPILFAILYLAITRRLHLLRKLSLIPATLTFLAIALPWHILAAIRNPAIAMPSGLGLPHKAGWAWFYLYNEHIARFLGRRIPHDYGQVPIPLFWLLLVLWLFPWAAFLPSAIIAAVRQLRARIATNPGAPRLNETWVRNSSLIPFHLTEAPLALLLWAGIILGFFTLSSRQEYYHLPALPALALLVGALLAAADSISNAVIPDSNKNSVILSEENNPVILGEEKDAVLLSEEKNAVILSKEKDPALLSEEKNSVILSGAHSAQSKDPDTARLTTNPDNSQPENPPANPTVFPFTTASLRHTLRASLFGLVPIGTLLFLICGYFAIFAPRPATGATLNDLLSSNPALYNLSLGHVFDLTGSAMGFFRWPLIIVATSALVLGPIQHLVRRIPKPGHTYAANLLIAAATTGMLLAAHSGYARFNPILGSKDIALAINAQRKPGDLILIDGELTSGSSLLFYTQQPAYLVNGRVNGPWFGSFWPDAPPIFLTDHDLTHLWAGPHRIFLLTYHPTERTRDLTPIAPVHDLTDSGGKTLLSNRN